MKTVDVLGVEIMSASDGLCQRVHRVGDRNQVNVVRHQAVREDVHAEGFRPLLQECEIRAPISVSEEHVLTVVSPLGDMVRNPWHNCPGDARHAHRLQELPALSRKPVTVPLYPYLSMSPLANLVVDIARGQHRAAVIGQFLLVDAIQDSTLALGQLFVSNGAHSKCLRACKG